MAARDTTTRHTASLEHLLRRRYRTLAGLVPSARDGVPEGIHQARVATRRLREALRMADAGRVGRKAWNRVRRVTRLLGPVRELDVALDLLREIESDGEAMPAGARVLREAIARERAALHADVLERLRAAAFASVPRRVLGAARRAAVASSGDAVHALGLAARRAERLRSALENAGSLYLPDRLHDVRVATKKLRYACEILHESGRPMTAVTARLKRSQDLLGRMHDLEVLILRTRGVQASPLAADPDVAADLARLVRRLETECRRLHGRYMRQRTALEGTCAGVASLADEAAVA
jgi:CHAD domain-containing protein